ncbi:B9 domain-containing protein 1 [Drosophila subpulchrella]|uniref:B9 domain-containing protein 1 n=1 Tax=Drosophila subpulchrella TaxID=1486046 RepID=UPI0018A16710|nr:B9 domain-containing protein 1 [Drosophila subpulchrella]XP_037731296.1 B9 domain-containing protein 1 [Drosophila subpulchrella]
MSASEGISLPGNGDANPPRENHKQKTRKKGRKKSKSAKESVPEPMDAKATATYFSVSIMGQIVSATFPMGPDKEFVFLRYEMVAGPDWQLSSGPQHGLTQMATNKRGHFNEPIVFNMPIEVTFKSTSPFGWPQILVSVFGRSGMGRETLLGYTHIHLPVFGCRRPADQAELLEAPILMPKCPTMLADITSWLLRREPELKDPKVLLDNLKCKGLSMESYGSLQFQLSSVMRGARKLGYQWHS